jgi:hypothetical protein
MNPHPCLLLLAVPSLAFSQEKLEPRDPVLSHAPARSEWTVRITEEYPDSWAADDSWEAQGVATPLATESPTIRSITYGKDSDRRTYHVTTRWTSGASEEDWIVDGVHVAERPDGTHYVVGAERLTAQELKVTDFPELAWVERKHFVGVRIYKGRKVFVFEEQFDRKRMTPTEARMYFFAKQVDPKTTPEKVFQPRASKVVAYLDVTTQLPVLCNDGRQLSHYSFKSQDAGRLRPPQAIIDFLRKRHAMLQARITPPAGPGGDHPGPE